MDSDQRIFRYVVAYDGGTAPRPFDGLCSLAICKPKIRAAAEVGDWIIGFRSRHPGEVLYAMQVTERLTLGDYWLDPRFSNRRPGETNYPDNFYSPTDAGTLEQVPNHVHVPTDAARDCRGRNALLGDRFWYFGANSVPLPNELLHLVHTTQGHSVHRARRPDDVVKLRHWLETWPVGMHGQPIRSTTTTQAIESTNAGADVRPVKSSCSSGDAPLKQSRGRAINASVQQAALPARDEGVTRRIVLSRKGFDGSYGGMPSPILPDGKLLALPIPARHDLFTMGDLQVGDVELPHLLHDLSRGAHSMSTRIHLDPDLDRRSDLRLPGWRPSLGQTGAAQSHLASQGVGIGDVFLFFGWFREVERYRQRWRFVPRAQNLHVVFGWLEIDEVLSVVQEREQTLARHPWIANHPHVANPAHYDNLRNTLYIAPISSRYRSGSMGGGLFSMLQPELQLTAPDGSRSQWNLPAWFHPGRRTPLSYHGDPGRWSHHPQGCNLRTVAKGQEFVLHATEYPESQQWLTNLVTEKTDWVHS